MVALVLFSLIHVPINIPAFALSTKVDDVDMNKELIAHGEFIISSIVMKKNVTVIQDRHGKFHA